MALILPWVLARPVVVEVTLDDTHLSLCSLFCVFLHTRINSGVNLQTVSVEINIIVLTPVVKFISNGLTEILCLSIVIVLHTIVELDRFLGKGVVSFTCQILVSTHVVEYHITTFEGIVGIGSGIIIGCSLEQTDKNSSLFRGQFLWCGTEICFCCSFDAVCIGPKIHCISIHGEDVFFIEKHLNLHSGNPFLTFHDEHFYTRDVAQQTCGILSTNTEHIFHQLLGDG